MYGEWWAAGQNRVPFLCNQLLLHLLTQIFETFQNVYWHTEDVHETDYDPIWRIFSIFFMLLKNICRGYLFCVINLLLFHWKIILCMIFRCLKQVLYSLLITIRLFGSDPLICLKKWKHHMCWSCLSMIILMSKLVCIPVYIVQLHFKVQKPEPHLAIFYIWLNDNVKKNSLS